MSHPRGTPKEESEVMWGFIRDLVWPTTVEEDSNRRDRETKKTTTKEVSNFTGRVTQFDKTTCSGMIDNAVYFDLSNIIGGTKPKIGVTAHVEATRDHSLAGWKATKVQLINQWQPDTSSIKMRNLIGHVTEDGRTSCLIYCPGEDEIVFYRDTVTSNYYPCLGDWVMVTLTEQEGEEFITEVKPLRTKEVTGKVDYFTGRHGTIDGDIGFTLGVCQGGCAPREGDLVKVECVEVKHTRMGWRATKVTPSSDIPSQLSCDVQSLGGAVPKQEEHFGIIITGCSDFENVEIHKKLSTVFTISNHGNADHTLVSCSPVSLRDQLTVKLVKKKGEGEEEKDEFVSNISVLSGESIQISIEIIAKVMGRLATAVIFNFGNFKMSCSVRANVIDKQIFLLEPSQAYVPKSQRKFGFNSSYQDKLKTVSVPGQRPARKRMLRLPHRLKQYHVPDDIREVIECQEDISFMCPCLNEPLSWESYQEYFTVLVHSEEVQVELNMREFDMKMASMHVRGQFLSLSVPGLAEGRPSLLVGDKVLVCEPGGDDRTEHFEGFIHEVHGSEILMKFSQSFHEYFHNQDCDVMFTFNRTPFRRMHHCIELVPIISKKVLFPHSPSPLPPLLRANDSTHFFNPNLNERQRSAVARILSAQGRPAPYVIFGPPGTGKTFTLVEAILQIYSLSGGSCRILATAPSNSASDLIAERLLLMGQLETGVLVRLNAFQRTQPPSDLLLPHCMDVNDIDTVARHRIIVSTCVTAGMIYSLGLPVGHFTHVFIDEAGQATEPETLIPLGLLAGTDRQVVLAGDPHQLGPILQSRTALHHGLGVSLLERLMNRPAYQRDEEKFNDHGAYDPLLVTKLVVNYRSHSSLLKLYSQIFYHNELIPAAESSLTDSLLNWEELPNPGFPLLFHGVIGEDIREGNSPSWFNPVEAVQVVRYTQSLLSGCVSLTSNDIGIITPYRKQVEKIRLLLSTTGLDDIKVGSVEEFQGQEKAAIIMSTVRSTSDLLTFDLIHNLGFLSNPKRFNVSISRAQALLVVVGNPKLLTKDHYWCQLVDYAVLNESYTGCPLNNDTIQPDEEHFI